jgi:putative endonuclease
MKTYFVYILRCADGSYYTGVTNDLNRRFAQHQNGAIPGSYTHDRRPIVLAWSQRFTNPQTAIRCEKQIKGWSRKKKEALIEKDIRTLKLLSNANPDQEKKNPSSSSG